LKNKNLKTAVATSGALESDFLEILQVFRDTHVAGKLFVRLARLPMDKVAHGQIRTFHSQNSLVTSLVVQQA